MKKYYVRKLKLRNEVKEGLFITALLLALVGIMTFDSWYTNQSINQCVNGGNSYDYCSAKLK